MRLINSKKGFNITEVPYVAVALLIIAIVIGIGATILTQVRDTSSLSSTSSLFDANSTFTTLNQTAVAFGTENAYDGAGFVHLVANSCTGTVIMNASNLADVTSDFTVSGCTALLTNNAINNTLVTANFTYTHNTYTVGYNISTTGLDAQKDFSDWQGTWVVILAAAVVLGIIGRYLFFQ